VALAAAYAAMMVVLAVESGSWLVSAGFLAISAAVIVPMVRHVHETLHPPLRRRRRAPGPPVIP
jgi:fatty acid desaturase